MCGICGIISFERKIEFDNDVRMMMNRMKHRGPDDEGVFIDDYVALGFVRLSILDLSPAGHQPMISDDNKYVIVFNGEIYNYIELRRELEFHNYNFKTKTDTEVLLAAYDYWGEDCLYHFNGMWAFAIYDRKRHKIFAARDRFGVKPFYYNFSRQQLVFASEIPSLLEILNNKPTPNYQVIFDYLVFNRTDQTEDTFFNEIKKLQHGHKIIIDLTNKDPFKSMKIIRWYKLREHLNQPFHSPEEFRELFSSAVNLRLRSDVPVGVSLSGGIDSSSITSVLLKDFNKRDLHTFSAVFGTGVKGDESEFINLFRSELVNMHYIKPDENTLFNDLHDFIRTHAEPLPSTSAYAEYKVMQEASKYIVVSLNGQGADEHLAGYHYFYGYYFKQLIKQFKLGHLTHELLSYFNKHKSFFGILSFLYFLLPDNFRTSTKIKKRGYLERDFSGNYSENNSITSNLYASSGLENALIDHFEYKIEHLLKWEDKNSMRFSIEIRAPFLDYRIVEKSLSMTANTKIRNGMTKYYLREAMKGTLNDKIRLRKDKIGYLTPEDEWMKSTSFSNFAFNLINDPLFSDRKIINMALVNKLLRKHIDGKVFIGQDIWKWINLELWFREFID